LSEIALIESNNNPEDGDAPKDARRSDSLIGGGEMGKVVRAMDWTKTPLGSIDLWPQSLRTTVSLCLASNFPISLAWGPNHIQIYNDGYWPICGKKHPDAMGQDFSECWASAWPVIGEAFERARWSVRPLFWKTRECFWTATATSKKRFSPFRSARSLTSLEA
jgi:hypothetical protein